MLYWVQWRRTKRRARPMTDITELAKRKLPLNLAIVHVDPDAFLATYRRWL